jgi:hypothetical protein
MRHLAEVDEVLLERVRNECIGAIARFQPLRHHPVLRQESFAGSVQLRELVLARPCVPEQIRTDLAHLDLLRSLGDPITTVVAIDVLERLVTRVPHAAVRLHRLVGGVATQPIADVVAHRHAVGDLALHFLVRHLVDLHGGLTNQQPQHLRLRVQLDQRPLNGLVVRKRFPERFALSRIRDAFVDAVHGGAERGRGLTNTVLVHEALADRESTADLTPVAVFGNPHVLDRDARVIRRHVERPHVLFDFHARSVRRNDEAGDAARVAVVTARCVRTS